MLQRLGHDVCSIIDNLVFHDLHKNVMQELVHRTSDIHYSTLIIYPYDRTNYIRKFVLCGLCHYYWTFSDKNFDDDDDDDTYRCRHCLNNIPKGLHINNYEFNPYLLS